MRPSSPITRLVALGLAAGLALTGCAGAPDATPGSSPSESQAPFHVSLTNCGVPLTLDAPPARAVALNQGVIEEVLSVGAAGQLAGTAYLDDAIAEHLEAAYATVPVLAEQYPTREAFLQATPDFALASYNSAFGEKGVGSREELAASGIGTYIDPFGCPNVADRPAATFENVWTGIGEVGAIFGRDAEATALIEAQRTRLASLRADRAGDGLRVVWWDGGDTAPSVGGAGGGPALVLDAVGATNVFADQPKAWASVSWEQVVAADPDVIVTVDASWDPAEQKRAHLQADPVLQNLRAVREGRIVTVAFSQSTPGVGLIDGARSLAEQLERLPA
ncbi:ABC transporter substrate-binding protein [Propioniciclava coleopterorum]|uniref:ABC transporter substrate-binding protein n=1 Tax=Propioniciclava coleopterorum TaxID=2714937 RepID=A0A6G7YAB3_9ACTN|nr:ABC transporter substrate-binding protein [Propioniciclava coleopterorum]QIK73659.1 ABC transporter substrate-binding protein [Propioniciclava coleopterorum]